MKYLLYSLLMMCLHTAYGQEPAMLWMKGITGTGGESVAGYDVGTNGQRMLRLSSNTVIGSGGNIDSICDVEQKRIIFLEYDSINGTIINSYCYGWGLGDSMLIYRFPKGADCILGGYYTVSGRGFIITKHDAADNIIWQKVHGRGSGIFLRGMLPVEDGGFILTGESHYTDTNILVHYGPWDNGDIWLLKVDSNGDKVWSIVIGGSGEDNIGRLVNAPGGGCYVVGYTESYDYDCIGNHSSGDAFAARVDKDGHVLWSKCLGGSGIDRGTSGCGNGSGGLLMGAYSASADGDVHHNQGSSDFWAVNMDSTGSIIWENSYGRPGGTEYGYDICRNNDGTIWMTGKGAGTSEYYGRYDSWLLHAAMDGSYLSDNILGSTREDGGSMVCAINPGMVLAGGDYGKNNEKFYCLPKYGNDDIPDVYLGLFAPWTTLINNVKQKEINIYPNPAHNKVTIKKESACTVYDMLGRVAYASAWEGDEVIDVSRWQPGMYYVHMGGEVQKLVVY